VNRQRPTGLTLIGAYYFLVALSFFLISLISFVSSDSLGAFGLLLATDAPRNAALTAGVLLLIFAVAAVVLGWKLWELAEWARVTSVVLEAMGGIVNLISGVSLIAGFTVGGVRITQPGSGIASILWALVHFGIVYYLTRPEVMRLFRTGRTMMPAPATVPTAPPPPAPLPSLPAASPRPAITVQPGGAAVMGASPLEATKLATPPRQARAWLAEVGEQGRRHDLPESSTYIGRDGNRCQIVLGDMRASGQHACIRYEHGQFVLHDMASRNGTHWNGSRVGQPTPLADGDRVRVGQTEYVFKEVRA
jgi:hypothetical protein